MVPPGVRVNVQLPVAGNPFNTTLPVDTVQVGWVIVPTVGAVGELGGATIITFADPKDVHPTELVTVKLYVPDDREEIVILVPVPERFPGFMVQLPLEGNPLNSTLPVPTLQVGWVIAPTVGAAGVAGWALIKILPEEAEIQPEALVTV